MANFLVFLGGLIGLICGLVAYVLFDTSILAAIAIWSVVGLAVTIGILFWLHRTKPESQNQTVTPPGQSHIIRNLF